MLSLSTKSLRQIHLDAVLIVVLIAAMSLPLLAQAPPSGDTFVSSSFGKTNFGSGIALAVQPGATTFIQFNLSTVPAGATVTKATLRLYVDAVTKSGSFDVYQVNSSWNESTLTYNTAPTPGASATGGHPTSVTSASYNQFLLIDITSLVQGWVSGSITNNGVALALTSSQGSFSFDSKESLLTGNGPELEIALAGAVGPQGPQGIQGPAGQQGAQGPAGLKGDTGATGPQGLTGSQGPQGATGAQGPQGPPGVDGAQGPAGPQGAAGQGFTFKGTFNNTVTYAPYDAVAYNGSSYVAKAAINPGDPTPDVNPNWSLIAQQGAAGAPGPAGAAGSQGPIGPQGPVGPQGPPGVPPPNVAVTNAPNTFAASQTVNGSLILGPGGVIQFGDGTTQSSAATGGSGVPPGYMILSSSPAPPAGYTLAGSFASGNLWLPMAPMPTGDDLVAAAELDGKIYVLGARLHPGMLQIYDTVTNTWSLGANLNVPRQFLAAAALNGQIYAIGGINSNGNTVGTVEVYDPSSNTWNSAGPLTTPRAHLAAAAGGSTIYAIGGLDENGHVLPTVEQYGVAFNTWFSDANLNTARCCLGAAFVNGKLYAVGGFTTTFNVSSALEVYDGSTNSWASLQPMPTARAELGATVSNGKLYAIGGSVNNTYINAVETYDPAGNNWSTVAPMLAGRENPAVVQSNSHIYAVGGSTEAENINLNEQYSPPVTLYTFVKN